VARRPFVMSVARRSAVALALVAALAVPAGAAARPAIPIPIGFAVTPYTVVGSAVTSIAFGPDTRDRSKTALYAVDFVGGRIVVIAGRGPVGGLPREFASGFQSPLGVLVTSNGTVFASDSEGPRNGPFGQRIYGRVWRLVDTNADGVADVKQVVLEDLPNGRHNTNGLAIGPDGMLYVANGNSTDDGIEGGEPDVDPWSGSVIRVDPGATGVSVTDLDPAEAVVATGMRNDYDIAFSPVDHERLVITTNGVDDARPAGEEGLIGVEDSDDLLYTTDTGDLSADDFGFPSCLYNRKRQGNLEPYDNPNPAVIQEFGSCHEATVPRPVASFGTHPSADGLAFQATGAWGERYRNDLFVAEFGSNPGLTFAGHKVVRVEFDSSGRRVTGVSNFLVGILPLDVAFDAAGNLYVADFSGVILRVSRLA
jgi:glucose/arabinose dehydrogenase